MRVCVVGLWHLGTVTAACLASVGHDVVAFDSDQTVVGRLSGGGPPLFEPGLEDLIKAQLQSGRLRFTTDVRDALRGASVVWFAEDTPVDADDQADVEAVVARIRAVLPHVADDTLVLISSQVPVGTTRRIETAFASDTRGRRVSFAYSPENLRLGPAIPLFMHPDRVVVGVRGERDEERLRALFGPITDRIEWMSVESAEMTKHAINAFLATSVALINEIAAVCEQVGADASEVERGLKSDSRIGPRAYLSAGAAFAGGTLARDVVFLSHLGQVHNVPTHLLSAVKHSNEAHRRWADRRLDALLHGVEGKTIAVWGLTYKPGTDTLRRSSAIELCEWLVGRGAKVHAHDPSVSALPRELASVVLASSPLQALESASALVVATPWPAYQEVKADDLVARMRRPLVLDASRFLASTIGGHAAVEYVTVGKGRL